ncbi:MAG: hypothetical protein C4344_07005 [Acidimicrobiia bacterium]
MKLRPWRAGLAGLVAVLAACTTGSGEVGFETRSYRPAGRADRIQEGGAGVPTTAAPAPRVGGLLPPSPAGQKTAGPANAPVAERVLRLGTVLPLQGSQRDFGEPILRTTRAFIDELNARGGVRGHRLELVAYNACLVCQDEALQAVRRLVEQDGVFALVNTIPMVVAFQPVIDYLVQKGVPLIQGGAENQTSDALSPVNFATSPPGLFYARFVPVMVRRHAGLRRVGIVYVNVPSEANGIPLLERELAREGVSVVDKAPVEAAEDAVTNMDSIVVRMRTRGAEGVVATNPVLLIYGRLAAARQAWNTAQWVGPAAWSRLVQTSCARTCDDLVLTDTGGLSFIDRDSSQMREYKTVLARRYPGAELTGHTLAAWVGMQLFVEIFSQSGPDRAAFLAAANRVRNLDLGTTSPLTFTPDRHLGGSASVLLRLKNAEYVAVSGPLSYGEATP